MGIHYTVLKDCSTLSTVCNGKCQIQYGTGSCEILLFDWIPTRSVLFNNFQICLNNMGWIRIRNWIRKICSWIRIQNKLFQIHNTDFYTFKGTMSHDFWPSFIRILTHLSQLFICWSIFADGFIFGEKNSLSWSFTPLKQVFQYHWHLIPLTRWCQWYQGLKMIYV